MPTHRYGRASSPQGGVGWEKHFTDMKKEYIIPVTEIHKLEIENAFCLNISGTEGSGEQFGKEFDDEDDEDYWD